MKEIKFRAWDYTSQIMSYSDEEKSLEAFFASHNKDYDDVVFMQFTGLKDNRGCEIYEGDVIAFYIPDAIAEGLGPEIGQVEWRNECCRFTLKEDRWDEGLHEDIVAEFATIIGNVYENPELMEGKE